MVIETWFYVACMIASRSYMLPDSPMMFQQTRSSRPVAKLKTVFDLHPTGGVLEVDLSPHGSIRSAGTGEYRWLMLSNWLGTDHFGGKSQRRDATADRFASWWWWWWTDVEVFKAEELLRGNEGLLGNTAWNLTKRMRHTYLYSECYVHKIKHIK